MKKIQEKNKNIDSLKKDVIILKENNQVETTESIVKCLVDECTEKVSKLCKESEFNVDEILNKLEVENNANQQSILENVDASEAILNNPKRDISVDSKYNKMSKTNKDAKNKKKHKRHRSRSTSRHKSSHSEHNRHRNTKSKYKSKEKDIKPDNKSGWDLNRPRSRDRKLLYEHQKSKSHKSRKYSDSNSDEQCDDRHAEDYFDKHFSKTPPEGIEAIDKDKLREIAIQNAHKFAKKAALKPEEIAKLTQGKSIDELTSFCKTIADARLSSDEDNVDKIEDNDIASVIKIKEPSAIVMNIRNAKQLPVLTPSEKAHCMATLRLQFPVSSGNQHRNKEDEWVPVTKEIPSSSTTVATNNIQAHDKVFPDPITENIDIGKVVAERLDAMRKLTQNPNDCQAISEVYKSQEKVSSWAQSKYLPGQFMGSTGVQPMSAKELCGTSRQAWLKKDTFFNAMPVRGGIGKALLCKMGWKEGTGLGKFEEGGKEPLVLDFKIDRKGLNTEGERKSNQIQSVSLTAPTVIKDLSGKHPVSALMELCSKRRWGLPVFEVIEQGGPAHKRNFLYKVMVNGVDYVSTTGSPNKKTAKAQAAALVLQEFGLLPSG